MQTYMRVIVILFLLGVVYNLPFAESAENQHPEASVAPAKGRVVSTPGRTVTAFVDAFHAGDHQLLESVVDPKVLPKFNASQRIVCPDPSIMGHETHKERLVIYDNQHHENSKRGDIEMYVLLKRDKAKLGSGSDKCKNKTNLWTKSAILLRNIDNVWRIVDCIPYWPDEIVVEPN